MLEKSNEDRLLSIKAKKLLSTVENYPKFKKLYGNRKGTTRHH